MLNEINREEKKKREKVTAKQTELLLLPQLLRTLIACECFSKKQHTYVINSDAELKSVLDQGDLTDLRTKES